MDLLWLGAVIISRVPIRYTSSCYTMHYCFLPVCTGLHSGAVGFDITLAIKRDRSCVIFLGKLFTPLCPCHQPVWCDTAQLGGGAERSGR